MGAARRELRVLATVVFLRGGSSVRKQLSRVWVALIAVMLVALPIEASYFVCEEWGVAGGPCNGMCTFYNNNGQETGYISYSC